MVPAHPFLDLKHRRSTSTSSTISLNGGNHARKKKDRHSDATGADLDSPDGPEEEQEYRYYA